MRGSELIAEFLKHSPLVVHLGMELREIEDDRAVLSLPFREEVVTIGDVVHGGAVSALVESRGDQAAVGGAVDLDLAEAEAGAAAQDGGFGVQFLGAGGGG